MKLTSEQEQYWRTWLGQAQDRPDEGCKVSASQPGSPEIADRLVDLYLQGSKTAGSGLLEEYLAEGDPLPQVGDHWIVLDSQERPRCILRTVRIETHRFMEVPERIAIAEGEGDLSLQYWRTEHERFFAPWLDEWGLSAIEDATVVTEFFQLVHPEKGGPGAP